MNIVFCGSSTDVKKRYCVLTRNGFVKVAPDGSPDDSEPTWNIKQVWLEDLKTVADYVCRRKDVDDYVLCFDAEDGDLEGQHANFSKWLAGHSAAARSGKLPLPQHVIVTPNGFVFAPPAYSDKSVSENEIYSAVLEFALHSYKELCFRYIVHTGLKDAVVLMRVEPVEMMEVRDAM